MKGLIKIFAVIAIFTMMGSSCTQTKKYEATQKDLEETFNTERTHEDFVGQEDTNKAYETGKQVGQMVNKTSKSAKDFWKGFDEETNANKKIKDATEKTKEVLKDVEGKALDFYKKDSTQDTINSTKKKGKELWQKGKEKLKKQKKQFLKSK